MSVAMLTILVTLAGLSLVHVGARAVRALVAYAGAFRPTHPGALLVHAVLPTGLAVSVALGLVLPAFLLFEPRHEGERAGLLLVGLAGLGAFLVSRIVCRAARMLRVSRELTESWRATASPLSTAIWGMPACVVDAGFPVVAVAGIFRPRLFVDRRVLEACATGELDAIGAHERAHVSRRDNVSRLLVGACEGPLSVSATRWRQAAEHAADTCAADTPERATNLAAALVKIARLAPARSLDVAVLSTIHDGGSLEARVRHLLAIDAPVTNMPTGVMAWLWLAPVGIALFINWPSLLSSVHLLVELLVRYLP